MRESGFDISFRFGPYGAATHHYAPVCLNSLLFKTELDLEEMSRLLGKHSDAEQWQKLGRVRRSTRETLGPGLFGASLQRGSIAVIVRTRAPHKVEARLLQG
ncbi:MAG: hypothetical protein DMG98_18215 [Acidobacteria bacterium]|nr:MAG: hypothetical protein DMG98_18215 [Acidobacteriota bacterium]